MVIAIFTESFKPVINGVSMSVDTFARSLTALGHSVHVFAPGFPGHTDSEPFEVHRFPSVNTTGAPDYPVPVPFSTEVRRLMRRLGPQLIHTQSPFFLGLAGQIWSRRLKIPMVTTHHTLYTEYVHYTPFLPSPVARGSVVKWTRWYCNRADHVVVPTAPIGDLLRRYRVKSPISVVPTGIDVQAIASARPDGVRERFGVPADAPLLIYTGRLAIEKNLGSLLEGFRRLRAKHPNAHLLLVGGGPAEAALHAQAQEMELCAAIHFAGFLDPTERDQCYAAATLFVHPSLTDTQGVGLCEAMAAGLPVVAARAFGSTAVVRDGIDGLLTTGDAHSLADACCRLLDDRDLRRLMADAARRGAERFSSENSAQALLQVYEETLASRAQLATVQSA